MKKKVAIIGAGQVAETVHIAYYRTREELELVAVVDPDTAAADAFAERNHIAKVYANIADLFANETIDIVSVCTPNRFHHQATLTALANGCHVMCEKPPALTAREAKEMWQLAEENGKILAYDFHHRFADDAVFLREKVKEGILGDVYVVKAQALRRCGIPGWGTFTDKDLQGGGPLIDIGIHMLDAALFVLGFPKVKQVNAHMFQEIGTKKSEGMFGKWDPSKYTVEDSLFGTIEFESGAILQLETSFALNMKEKSIMNVSFYGNKAGAQLFPAEIFTDEKGELVSLYQKQEADEKRHEKSMKAFVDRCLGEDVLLADGEQGTIVQQIVEALYQSAEKGESIQL